MLNVWSGDGLGGRHPIVSSVDFSGYMISTMASAGQQPESLNIQPLADSIPATGTFVAICFTVLPVDIPSF